LVLVIQKAGLKPVIADIFPGTFNLNVSLLPNVISENTLAVLAVHMFGLACEIDAIVQFAKGRGVFVIEDCAQALGTKMNGRMTGTIGDAGFYSFNRGKNLPTYSGGCIAVNSEELQQAIIAERELLDEPGIFLQACFLFKLAGVSLAMNRLFYGLFYPIIAPFKSNSIPREFSMLKYTDIQAAVGISLLRRVSEFSETRRTNGLFLMEGLKDIDSIVLPKIPPDSTPAFNRLPVVFKDAHLREKAHLRLWNEGIESSYMYPYVLHQVYDLGYKKDDFPNAVYLAGHILTLPVHPLVPRQALEKIIEIIRGLC
jgi:dTDP-4-amino-4,6-dideoxygalactose transaminase